MSKTSSLLQRYGANINGAVAPRVGEPATLGDAPLPDRYANAVRARQFAELPVDSIAAESQARSEFDSADLARLAESIKRYGQLAPIRVRFDETRATWIVLVGERRLRACRLAGLERIRVEFVDRAMSEADVLAEQVVENAVRADLQPVEQARAFRRLMDLNHWTAQQLAETLNVEPTGVYRCLALLKLPEDVAARVDSGEIKATAAYELTKLNIADDQREVAERVVSDGLDHKATVAEVTRRRTRSAQAGGKAKTRARMPAEQRFKGSRGVRLTVQATAKHSMEDLVADLREIADRLEAHSQADQAA